MPLRNTIHPLCTIGKIAHPLYATDFNFQSLACHSVTLGVSWVVCCSGLHARWAAHSLAGTFLDLALAWACLCLAAAARILALPDLLSSGAGALDGPRGAESLARVPSSARSTLLLLTSMCTHGRGGGKGRPDGSG